MTKKDNNKLQIVQWNARSAVSNKYSLIKCLEEHNVDIALISETWFNKDTSIKFSGYNLVRKDRYDGYAGVAILIKKHFKFKELQIDANLRQDISICGIEIPYNNNHLKFISVYYPPNLNVNENELINIFSCTNGSRIVGGDFNAHHATWGSYKNNITGQRVISALDNLDLIILNDGSPTRLTKENKISAVDLTLATPNVASLSHWQTITDTLGSDHFPILLQIDNHTTSQENQTVRPKSKWNTNKANWVLYDNVADNYFASNPNFQDIDEKYNYFIQGINTAAQAAIPINKPFQTKNRVLPPWWNHECDEIVNNRKQVLNTFKQDSK